MSKKRCFKTILGQNYNINIVREVVRISLSLIFYVKNVSFQGENGLKLSEGDRWQVVVAAQPCLFGFTVKNLICCHSEDKEEEKNAVRKKQQKELNKEIKNLISLIVFLKHFSKKIYNIFIVKCNNITKNRNLNNEKENNIAL